MNSKVRLSKVKVLVNSTTQQREQQRYQLPSIGNQSLEIRIWRLDGDYFLGQPCPFRLWLANLAFLYSLATIEQAHRML